MIERTRARGRAGIGILIGLAGLIAAGGAAALAATGEVKSIYTTIDLKSCKTLQKFEDGASWYCPGTIDGYDVLLSEGDLRFMVSYGKPVDGKVPHAQTLKSFNTIFKGNSDRAALEWRAERRGAVWIPYATILRYYTSSDASGQMVHGQVLVVSKVGIATGADSCHVAYVDSRANKDANALARKAADELARTFDCLKEPVIYGKTGRSPM